MKKSAAGFTIIEVMVTVGIMAMLFGIVVVGINPARQISKTRNAKRLASVASIQSAINHYAIDTFGGYPSEIDGTMRMIGSSATGCTVSCGPDTVAVVTSTFLDNSLTTFNTGTFNNTAWSTGSSSVILNATGLTNKSGNYLSGVKDAGSNQTWSTFSWTPAAPYNKELPNNGASESGYSTGNASMTGNVVLMHMNNASGAITDSSGSANNGSVSGNINYSTTGKLNTGLGWNGSANAFVQIPHAANLNLPNTGGTVMLWINPTITNGSLPQNTGMGVIRKHDYAPNVYSSGGYGIEIYRNLTSQPANIRAFLGNNNGSTAAQQTITGTTTIANNTWYHVALSWNASTMYLYVNGALDTSATRTATLGWSQYYSNGPLYLGHNGAAITGSPPAWYTGTIDELALFARQLTTAEIAAAFERGAFKLRAQLRTCDDALCNGETLKGPDGSSSSYYDELTSASTTPPSFTITNQLANRYFQYQIFFDSIISTYGPQLKTVSASNNGAGGGGTTTTEQTADACINLAAKLAPTYITSIPFDPQTGSLEKSYYAVKKLNRDNLVIRACTPELGESIQVSQ